MMDYEWLYKQLIQEIQTDLEVATMQTEIHDFEISKNLMTNSPAYMWACGRKSILECLLANAAYFESVQRNSH